MTHTGAVKAAAERRRVIFILLNQYFTENPAALYQKKIGGYHRRLASGWNQDLVCTRRPQTMHKLCTGSSPQQLESRGQWPHIIWHDRNGAATTGDEEP
jgi:hypothetical protein